MGRVPTDPCISVGLNPIFQINGFRVMCCLVKLVDFHAYPFPVVWQQLRYCVNEQFRAPLVVRVAPTVALLGSVGVTNL